MTGISCEETFFPTCTVVAAQPFENTTLVVGCSPNRVFP